MKVNAHTLIALQKPASLDDFLARHGPYDPPLTAEELAEVQRFIDDPDPQRSLILRAKFESSPLMSAAAEEIKRLQTKLDRWLEAAKADGYPCDEPNCYQEVCHLARGEYDYVVPPDSADEAKS